MRCRLGRGVNDCYWILLLLNCKFYVMKQWQAVLFPLSLTCLMYTGSLVHKSLLLLDSWILNSDPGISFHGITFVQQAIFAWLRSLVSNISVWRNYVVVSILPIQLSSWLMGVTFFKGFYLQMTTMYINNLLDSCLLISWWLMCIFLLYIYLHIYEDK